MVFNIYYVIDPDLYRATTNRNLAVGEVACYQDGNAADPGTNLPHGCAVISVARVPDGFFDKAGKVLVKIQDGNMVPANPPEVVTP